MRRLTPRLHAEDGAVMVMAAVLLVVLIGLAAFAIDVDDQFGGPDRGW